MIKKTLSFIILNLLIFSFSLSSVKTVLANDLGNWNLLRNSNSCTLANLFGVINNVDGVTGLVIHSKGKGATLLNSEWELKDRYSNLKFIFDRKVHRTVSMQVKENRVNFSLDRPNDLKVLLHKHNTLSIKSRSGKPIADYSLEGFQDGYNEFLKCNGIQDNFLKKNIASTTTSNSYGSNSNQKKSTKLTDSQKKSAIILLGLLGVAAIASSNGDVVAKGILQGFGCAAAGNPSSCSNMKNNDNNEDSDEFKWGANYQKVGNMAIGEGAKFTRVGNTFLYDRSNGVRYKKIGDTLYGDDGTNCRNVGSLTFCD